MEYHAPSFPLDNNQKSKIKSIIVHKLSIIPTPYSLFWRRFLIGVEVRYAVANDTLLTFSLLPTPCSLIMNKINDKFKQLKIWLVSSRVCERNEVEYHAPSFPLDNNQKSKIKSIIVHKLSIIPTPYSLFWRRFLIGVEVRYAVANDTLLTFSLLPHNE
ncbi:MAG: hypothetical protein SWX82_17280 [Cyanobacteriota bacterium]|nr:hypothetical protein [Cyanobacteriota bacterium]